jgi:hypothetical protein
MVDLIAGTLKTGHDSTTRRPAWRRRRRASERAIRFSATAPAPMNLKPSGAAPPLPGCRRRPPMTGLIVLPSRCRLAPF